MNDPTPPLPAASVARHRGGSASGNRLRRRPTSAFRIAAGDATGPRTVSSAVSSARVEQRGWPRLGPAPAPARR